LHWGLVEVLILGESLGSSILVHGELVLFSVDAHVFELIVDLHALLVSQRESFSVDQVLDDRHLSQQILFGLVSLVDNNLVKILRQKVVINIW
jgi:hypothetical protein